MENIQIKTQIIVSGVKTYIDNLLTLDNEFLKSKEYIYNII